MKIKPLCIAPFLLSILLFSTSCTTVNDTKDTSSPTSSSASTVTTTSTTVDFIPETVIVPMDNVPSKYYNVDKQNLTLAEKSAVNSPSDVYIDADGSEYYFDKVSGEYRGFSPAGYASFGAAVDSIPMETLQKAADELASHFIDISAYERTYFFQKDTLIHKFNYRKKINGYSTADSGNVWITSDGNVAHVRFYNTGIFDEIDIPIVDEQTLDEKFLRLLVDRECQTIHSRILTMQDNELYILYDYDYLFTKNGTQLTARDVMYVKLE